MANGGQNLYKIKDNQGTWNRELKGFIDVIRKIQMKKRRRLMRKYQFSRKIKFTH